ncbi:MAG: DUF4198 domain-containing protein [Pseudomonadota bacterium]
MLLRSVCFFVAALATGFVHAHELFLQPQSYQIAVGDPLLAEVKVGEDFDGGRNIFNPEKFRQFDLAVGNEVVPIPGRLGDMPAANITTDADGLHILVHVSQDLRLRYTKFEKFEKFIDHKDLKGTLGAHAARGLSTTDFVEAYSRYAKSLVAVGSGVGQDRTFGLETEIVALANPYTDDLDGEMPVQVFYQQRVRPDAQVELFERLGDEVKITLHRTDANGVALLPVKAGAEYMVDAVVIREPSAALAEKMDAVWETLWANLTFAVPR